MKKITLYTLFLLGLSQGIKAQFAWQDVGGGTNAPVHVLRADTINNILYAGGVFSQAGTIPGSNIAKWDGSAWSPIGSGIISGLSVSSMLMKDGDLIIGGTFTDVSGVLAKNVAKWTGSAWLPLGAGLEYTGATTVSTLCEYGGELYAGGTFLASGLTPVNYIAKYDGVNWTAVGGGTNGRVLSLCVYGSELYVGGEFTDAGGVPVNNIAKWDGTTWSDVGGGVQYTGATTVSTMQVYNGDLYVGGTFDQAGAIPVMNIAKWDGSTWSDVGGGVQYTGATTVSTLSMTIYNNELIVGGNYDIAGSIVATYIGKWDGVTWTTLGSGMNNAVLALETLHDTLYAGGVFTTAGGDIALFVAQWTEDAVLTSSVNGAEAEDPFFIVYPNPVEDRLSFAVNPLNAAAKGHDFDLIISDITGREIHKQENINADVLLNRESIPPGLYLYKVISKDRSMVQQGKLSFR